MCRGFCRAIAEEIGPTVDCDPSLPREAALRAVLALRLGVGIPRRSWRRPSPFDESPWLASPTARTSPGGTPMAVAVATDPDFRAPTLSRRRINVLFLTIAL